jgi:tRNA nucleotidyltransferase (CCA-adding enzyme)
VTKAPLLIPEPVLKVIKTLKQGGFSSYLVGGCTRDLIMKIQPKDWDIATNAIPEKIISLFPKTFYNNTFGTVTVVSQETPDPDTLKIEITPFRSESSYTDKRRPDQVIFGVSISEDLSRRDFTINAIAYDPDSNLVIDPHKGQDDIKDKIVRAVGNPDERFSEDPLRMIRAVRIATELMFQVEQNTEKTIKNKVSLIDHVSRERVRDEITRIINSKNPYIGLEKLRETGILEKIIPELCETFHVKQNGAHKYDVWEHILRALQHSADKDYPFHVKLASLFHDIGKPRTRRFDRAKKDYTFYGHEVVGERISRDIMDRLRFSRETSEKVRKLVRNHMFFSDVDKITLSAVRRIIRKVGKDDVWDLIKLRISDRIGMGRPKESPYRLRKYESMIEEAMRSPTSVNMLNIDGNRIMAITDSPPSPKIGLILHALLEEVLEDPALNNESHLNSRAKELAALPESELKKLGKIGEEKKKETEEQKLKKIRQKYGVK